MSTENESRIRDVEFRYNTVFFPEYLSTILISLPISALCLALPGRQFRPLLWGNWHVGVAFGLYFALVCWLLLITLRSRYRFHSLTVHAVNGPGGALPALHVQINRRNLPVDELDFAQEQLGSLYGRRVRRIILSDGQGEQAEMNDALLNYEACCELLARLGCRIRRLRDELPELNERIARAWEQRHDVFPLTQTPMDVLGRLGWRLVCLVPVAAIDALINLLTILFLSRLQQQQLLAYAAPLSLMVSALIARYLYFYLFTSTALNRPLV